MAYHSLVTGGSGFIGSHVVDKLLDAGHKVTVVDHRVKPHRWDIEFKDVDIVDLASVLQATKGVDFFFHLAAISNVNHAFENPVYATELNIQATVNCLEAARQNKVKRFIFASTVWVYSGSPEEDVDESSPFVLPGAGHIYSSSKIAAEFLIHDYWNLYEVPFTILRYGIPYGPRMRRELVLPIFLRKAFANEPITITGDGSQYRNFVYVEDMADAHILSLDEAAKNEVINLEGMRPVTIKEMAETVRDLANPGLEIQYLPARPGDYKGKTVSATKAKKLIGWEPKIDFREGMEKTLAWFREVTKNSRKE